MIRIVKNKKHKKYQKPPMPKFEDYRKRLAWEKHHEKMEVWINAKSVSVQKKDIMKMIYSPSFRLVDLYVKCHSSEKFCSFAEDDWITITKFKPSNKALMFELISADWLLDVETVAAKTIEELKQDYIDAYNEICRLDLSESQSIGLTGESDRKKLLEHKLSCLDDIILSRSNSEEQVTPDPTGKVFRKENPFI